MNPRIIRGAVSRAILLQGRSICVGYPGGRSGGTMPASNSSSSPRTPAVVAGPLDLELVEGRLVCLLGPNGSGKSTLLRTLAGLQPLLSGQLEITGKPMSKLRPADLARQISLVLTDPVRNSNLTVRELVSLGRYPYSGWLGTLSAADLDVTLRAMKDTGVDTFQQRKLVTLSDGESQKVMLARALAQDTPLMMLDEPTAHLDLPSRIQLMQLLHRLVRRTGKGVLVSTHELDLALQVADEVWLLREGGKLDKGGPEDLVLGGVFEEAFHREGVRFDKSTGTFHMQMENGPRLRLLGGDAGATGPTAALFWTRRALQRNGFTIAEAEAPHTIIVIEDKEHPVWRWEGEAFVREFGSIGSLLEELDKYFPGSDPNSIDLR